MSNTATTKTFSICGKIEEIEALNKQIKDLASENKCTTLKVVQDLIANKDITNIEGGGGVPDEQYNAIVNENNVLHAQIQVLEERLAKSLQWRIPANMGAVVLELISNQGDMLKDIHNVDEACDYLLTPYWRKGVFKPSQEEVNNYLAIFDNER